MRRGKFGMIHVVLTTAGRVPRSPDGMNVLERRGPSRHFPFPGVTGPGSNVITRPPVGTDLYNELTKKKKKNLLEIAFLILETLNWLFFFFFLHINT